MITGVQFSLPVRIYCTKKMWKKRHQKRYKMQYQLVYVCKSIYKAKYKVQLNRFTQTVKKKIYLTYYKSIELTNLMSER